MTDTRFVGIIAGLGPAAMAIYRRALLTGLREAGRRLRLIEETADVDAVLQAAGAGDAGDVAALLARHVHALEARGAEVLAVAGVTPHVAADALRKLASGCELIVLVKVLNEELRRRRLSVVGLIGTRTVVRSRLFRRLVVGMVPLAEERTKRIHHLYLSIVSQRSVPAGVAKELLREANRQSADGAEAVVGGNRAVAHTAVELERHPGCRLLEAPRRCDPVCGSPGSDRLSWRGRRVPRQRPWRNNIAREACGSLQFRPGLDRRVGHGRLRREVRSAAIPVEGKNARPL